VYKARASVTMPVRAGLRVRSSAQGRRLRSRTTRPATGRTHALFSAPIALFAILIDLAATMQASPSTP